MTIEEMKAQLCILFHKRDKLVNERDSLELFDFEK